MGQGKGYFSRFISTLKQANEQGQYDEILWYAQQIQ